MTDVAVHLDRWTAHRAHTAGDTITRFTLVYVEAGKEYRPGTFASEAEARAFAERHGWTVSEEGEL